MNNEEFTIDDAISQFKEKSYVTHFIEYLINNGMNKDFVQYIMKRSRTIIEKMGTKPHGVKGLLVGKVQSGKTSTFATCIATAFKVNYNIAIVLTGRDNVLNKQTFDRLSQMFTSDDFSTNVYVYQVKDVISSDVKIFADEINNGIKDKRKYIFVGLKNQQISKLTQFLSIPLLQKTNILIVDDEGDLASFNTAESKNEESATYKMISEMINTFSNRCSYLSVTATPQAHILLKKSSQIKPDFIATINPGKEYMGIKDFFGKSWNKYIRVVSEKEKTAIENDFEQTPESLKKSILYYIFSCCLFHLENKKIKKTTMLVHTAKKIIKHNLIASKIIAYIKTIENFLKMNDSDEYNKLIKTLKQISLDYDSKFIWNNNLINLMIWHLKMISVNVVNSETDDPLYKNTPNNIIIGSQMVERGVTFNNLLTTYITNRAEELLAIDTALQRARWFGYRKKYQHLIRIFMLEKMVMNFKNEILNHDENLWNILEHAEINNIPFSEIERNLLVASKDLIATNKVKHHRIHLKNVLFNHTTKQSNVERMIINNFFALVSKSKNKTLATFSKKNDEIQHTLLKHIEAVKLNKIMKFIKYKKEFMNILNLNETEYDFLYNKILNNDKQKVTIAIMSEIKNYDDKMETNNDEELHVFREKNANYEGDKNCFKNNEFENELIIQIHQCLLPNGEKEKFLTFILPKKIVSEFVVGD